MVRWMCGVSLSDRKPDEVRDRLSIESITCVKCISGGLDM